MSKKDSPGFKLKWRKARGLCDYFYFPVFAAKQTGISFTLLGYGVSFYYQRNWEC